MHSFLGRSTPCIVKIYPCPNSIGYRANKKFVKKRKKKWYKLSHKKRKQLGSQSHTIVLGKYNKTLLFYNTLLIKYDGGYRSDLTWRIHNNCEYIYILFLLLYQIYVILAQQAFCCITAQLPTYRARLYFSITGGLRTTFLYTYPH